MTQTPVHQLVEHFGLKACPFEAAPDPRLFLPAPAHSEALALIEYAVHAGKGCAAIAGPSGSGKTMLARMAFRECIRQGRDVLWVDAIGQPVDATEATRYSPRVATSNGGPGREETTLEAWARSDARSGHSLVIVDDADALTRRGWTDLISLMTRDARAAHPATILLFGLPVLLKRLATPGMLRIRRRMFRALRLEPLDQGWLRRYLEHRVTQAGGALDSFLSDDGLEAIGALTGGNPGLVNQLCESAMVNAFAEGERRIRLADVEAAADATLLNPPSASADASEPRLPRSEASEPPCLRGEASEPPRPRGEVREPSRVETEHGSAEEPVADTAGTMALDDGNAPVKRASRSGDQETAQPHDIRGASDPSAPAAAVDSAPDPKPPRQPSAADPRRRAPAAVLHMTEPPEVASQMDALEARVLRVLAAVQDVISVTHDECDCDGSVGGRPRGSADAANAAPALCQRAVRA